MVASRSLAFSLSLSAVAMDSGNSGSMQSSSGGDEEYDSRSESISAFFNSSSHGGAPMSNAPPPMPPSSQQHNPSMFDSLSLSHYLDPFQRSPNSNMNPLLNLDSAWSRGPSSEPNCSEPQIPTLGSTGGPFQSNPSMLLSDNSVRAAAASADQPPAPRNPKKRSRASRRAPTTVLTTDTTNFRAMVQEFTGIPAPPFSASPFPRGGRLDLFGTSLRTGLADPLQPPYLLRPFAQKLQRSSALSSLPLGSPPAMADSAAATNPALSTANANAFQLPSDLGLPKHNQNLLNMQSSILALQSLLQASPAPKYPLSNLPLFGAKSQGQTTNPMLNEFAASRGSMGMQLGSLSNPSASDAMSLRSSGNPSTWGDGVVGLGPNDGDQGQLKSFGGNSQQRVSSCKLNFAASSSDFQSDKGAENGSSRGEGMVDSWICSSE
ncbi:hypothetical protein ACLOJK_016233 [Asimina triloba]